MKRYVPMVLCALLLMFSVGCAEQKYVETPIPSATPATITPAPAITAKPEFVETSAPEKSEVGEIDREAYEKYKDAIDPLLGELTHYGDDIRVERQLYSLTFEYADERLGAEIYDLQTVCIVDPVEEAGRLVIGEVYLDSQMRAHGTHGPSYLVVVDGEPLGFVYWDVVKSGKLMKTNMDGSFSEFESKEELIEWIK